MTISIFNLFSIGLGPSSSHTVGPIRAANSFLKTIEKMNKLTDVATIKAELFGSLALTGIGHGTDKAVILGLLGFLPETVDPEKVDDILDKVFSTREINLLNKKNVPFIQKEHLVFYNDKTLPKHPNGMRFTALSLNGDEILSDVYYSIGGGFVLKDDEMDQPKEAKEDTTKIPYPFNSGNELLNLCQETGLNISQLVMENEKKYRSEDEIKKKLLKIWEVMKISIDTGCKKTGFLPGGLNVKRRANTMLTHLLKEEEEGICDPVAAMKWMSLWALAVNEENASYGRIVTAPTNGSAGIIPSIIQYYLKFTENPCDEGIISFLLTAGAIGLLFKANASISGAEMGCMGEVGVACAMAAAGLTSAIGGTAEQIENAAEIGMEHNLGLTCDPVGGLVQIPCIERNTMGAVKALNASLLALVGTGKHRVSLDQVIATMKQTGKDMQSIYKETSLGGLAVNVPEC